MQRLSPATLSIILSHIESFLQHKHKQEQYMTPCDVAAQWLHSAYNDIASKTVADFGCGTGMLSIGCALLGASVTAYDSDAEALAMLKKNIETVQNITQTNIKQNINCKRANILEETAPLFDTVITNPPFGTKQKGVDVQFLTKACISAQIVWSMHKTTTMTHIRRVAEQLNFIVTDEIRTDFAIPKSHEKHQKEKYIVDTTIVRLQKNA